LQNIYPLLFILFIYFNLFIYFHQSIQKVHIKKKQFNKTKHKKTTQKQGGVKTPQNINVRHLCRTYTIKKYSMSYSHKQYT
jgi:hypothetical protein